jgi:UDP-glucose 4-epimerase
MQTILITGSEGFIGRKTAIHMKQLGYKVFTTDLRESKYSWDHRVADLSNVNCWADFQDLSPDLIIHLGAQVDVRDSFINPTNDLLINAFGTLKLLEYGISKGITNFVYINSGGAIYGAGQELPTRETQNDFPISPYGATKLIGESYVRILCSQFNVNWTSLALSNCYGPVTDHGKGVIYEFCKAVDSGEMAVINGKDVTRDFIYVGDVLRAIELAVKEPVNSRVNISSNSETSLGDLYSEVCSIKKVQENCRYRDPAPGEVLRSRLDNSLARELLGWEPITSLKEGLKLSL